MADWFVEPVMEKLIDACLAYLKDQVRWQTGMKEELQSLRVIHPQIKVVVSACSQVEIEDPDLNKWLWQLRDAIDEADDVLDEFEYWKRDEKQVSENKKIRKVRSLMKSLKKRFVKIYKRALRIDPYLKRLEVVVHNLYEVSNGVSNFLRLLDRANQDQQQQQLVLRETRETGSMTNTELLGRSEEKEFLRQWLRKPYQTPSTDNTDSYRNFSLLSVVGDGGMGKTTLLQHAYEDEMMKEFNVKMWICVSTNFKAKTVISNILKSLKKQMSHDEPLEQLQRSLQYEVMSKRFLLVLDDIWEDNEREWKKVLDPLSYGSSGSKILITTRMDSVASTFAKMIKRDKEVLRLEGMEEDECFLLLSTHAFAGVENPDEEFRSIAVKMVKKLSGCPLAAKVIGGILNLNFDKHYWRNVLNTNIEKVEQGQNDLLPILKLSYIYLPKFLKNCFTFCCIFRQDHEFDRDDLVRMWIALGFIQSSDIQGETLEDTGRRYFNILVQKSFFDEFRSYGDKVYYKMHDILHELAQSVSTKECLRVDDYKEMSVPDKTVRHLFIHAPSTQSLEATFKKMGKFKNLRSLFLSFLDVDEEVLSEILKAYKSIRLLVIHSPYNYELEMVGCLNHLRYLKVEYRNKIFKLPRSISHLYHLRFIISEGIENLEMDNLCWKACNWLQGGIRNSSSTYIRNSPSLIHLTGQQELKINENCQLLTDKLVIKDPSVLLMVPQRSIGSFRSLIIKKNNLLVSFPSGTEQWFLQHNSSLFRLKFKNLRSLQSLPSFFESLSSLKTLEMYNVPQLKLLPNLPASLQELELRNVESLQCLPSCLPTILIKLSIYKAPRILELPDLPPSLEDLWLKEIESLQCLPSCLPTPLKRLWIVKAPRLLELPDLPPSLEDLSLKEIESLQYLPSCLSTTLLTLWIIEVPRLLELPDLPSPLRCLELEELESLQRLPSSLPTGLRKLSIIKVPRLLELPSLSSFYSLMHLELKNIPLLESLPDLPLFLEDLLLEEIESLQCLPSSLPIGLRELRIIKVPRILELPDLPASLRTLYIKDCHPHLMRRYPNSNTKQQEQDRKGKRKVTEIEEEEEECESLDSAEEETGDKTIHYEDNSNEDPLSDIDKSLEDF